MKRYILILSIFFLWSCQEEELPLFHGKTCVYFSVMDNLTTDKYTNQMSFSFGLTTAMDTVINVPVKGTGDTVGYDRYFSYVVDSTSAQEGVHFDKLPEKGIFPAGSATGYIPVTLHRILDDNELYHMYFRLVSDNEFEVNIPAAYYNSDTTDLTRLTLSFSSSIAKPPYWMDNFFGYFSLAKYNLCYELTGQDWSKSVNAMLMVAYGNIFKNYVESKILEGKEAALRDPQNKYKGEEGYMTMRGHYQGYEKIPAEWFESE